MPRDWPARAAFVLTLIGSAGVAVAGPPFLTDDPAPVDLHHAEVNLIAQQSRTSDGRAASASGEINYGCLAETQCHVAVPTAYNHAAGETAQFGLGDVELGVKYRFFNRPDDGWSAAVYPTLNLPSGDAGRGLGNGRTQLLLPLWIQRSSGPWSLDAGVGRLINRAPATRDSWFFGLLAQRSFGDTFSLGGELYRRTSTADATPAVTGFNLGAIINVAPRHNVLVSAGRGLTNVETNRSSMFLAYQLEL